MLWDMERWLWIPALCVVILTTLAIGVILVGVYFLAGWIDRRRD